MTIELRVPFFEKDDALEFQRYLKKNGCQSRLETSLDFLKRMKYSGTIGNLETFINNLETRDCSDPDREYEKEDIEQVRNWVNNYKECITEFYAKCEVGVPYPGIENILNTCFGIDTGVVSEDLDDDEEAGMRRKEEMKRIAFALSAAICLKDNECLVDDRQANTVTLTQKKPVGDLGVEMTSDGIFGIFDPEEMKKAGIAPSLKTIVESRYTVIAGPEFITMDLDDLIEYLSGYGYDDDEEESDEIIHIRMCSVLIHRIMEIIRECPVSGAELTEKLLESATDMPVSFEVMDEALPEILSDMRKLGIITVKNGLVKPGR